MFILGLRQLKFQLRTLPPSLDTVFRFFLDSTQIIYRPPNHHHNQQCRFPRSTSLLLPLPFSQAHSHAGASRRHPSTPPTPQSRPHQPTPVMAISNAVPCHYKVMLQHTVLRATRLVRSIFLDPLVTVSCHTFDGCCFSKANKECVTI